jgi:heptose I phosphotransferase
MMGCDELYLPQALAQEIGGDDPFERVMQLQGAVFRDVPGRRTLRFELGGRAYFAKLHFGVGWREIFKNLCSLRLPIVSARTEWRAIQRLGELGIATTPAVAYGCRGSSPASLRSFIITEDLGDIVSLEDYCRDWLRNPPQPAFKRRLLRAVADVARGIHEHGLNHRDFYICHLCLDRAKLAAGDLHLYLIDLHRMQARSRTPDSARMKDMAALYFSALDAGLTQRDCLRFVRHYFAAPLVQSLRARQAFWRRVDKRARKLYHKFHGCWPDSPFDGRRNP